MSFSRFYLRLYLGHWVFFSLLLSQLVAPLALRANDVPRQDPPTESPLPLLTINLDSTETVSAHAQEIANLVRNEKKDFGRDIRLHFFHIKGQRPDPKLLTLIALLAREGIKLEGTILSKEQFEDIVDKNSALLPTEDALMRFSLTYQGNDPDPSSRFSRLASILSPGAILKRLGDFKNKLFGLPHGFTSITVFRHFFAKGDDDRWHWRFRPDWQMFRFALGTAIWGATNLSLIRYFGADFFDKAPLEFNQEFWAINALILTWVFTFLFLSREVASFKEQGVVARFEESLEPGHQLVISPSSAFFTSSSILQEWALKSGIIALQAGFGAPVGADKVWKVIENGVLGAFSYVGPEDVRSKLLLKSESLKDTDPAAAQRYRRAANWLGWIFWNLIFATCINMHFFIDGEAWARIPFVILGVAGIIWKISKENETGTSTFGRMIHSLKSFFGGTGLTQETACSNLLVLHWRPVQTDESQR